MADLLRGREGRAQPVLDLEAVAPDVRDDLHHAEREHPEAAEPQRGAQPVVQAVVDDAAELPREQRGSHVADHRDGGGAREHAQLPAALPEHEAPGAGQRRSAGVGQGEGSHVGQRYG